MSTCIALSKQKYHYTYITVFMFNSNEKEKGKNQLYITSYLSDTNVLVTVNKSPFKHKLTIQDGKSVTVEVPSDTELRGTGKYSKTVMIRSSKFITIVSSNQKTNSVETSLVYPVTKLGQEYYVFTPSASGYPKELAVFGLYRSTSVTVELKCTVTFEGKTYKPNEKLTARICASVVLYLESNEDCTGSRVVSDKPVGVISGHACASKNSKCQHTFEQLLPVEHWGTSYIVPPLEYQNLQDSVFVFASQLTRFTYTFGPKSQIAVIKAGQWKEIPMGRNPPLVISSDQPIQVLYYCNGGKFSDGSEFDPFIMNIVPNQQFCEYHTLEGMEDFWNYALIIAMTKDINKVQFDDTHPSFNWQQVHDTEYSWAHYTYKKGRGHHTMKSPCAPIGVYSVGTKDQNSYGAPAACGLLTCHHNGQYYSPGKPFWEESGCTELCECNPSTGLVTCQKSQCKPEEECKVVKGVSECVAKTITAPVKPLKVLPCTHKGQSHPPGKPFWDGSGCTELCECNPSTGLVTCQKSQCKPEEECKVVKGVTECVAKTIPPPVKPLKVLPCTHKGQSHPPGKPFWDGSGCTELCVCNPSTGLVTCQKSQCKPEEECKVVKGVSECVAKTIPAPVKPLKVLPCTHKGQSHPPGKPFWDGSDCTELCECNPSTGLVTCQKSQCKPEEECKVMEGIGECVAKTIPASVHQSEEKYPFVYITVYMFNSKREEKSKNALNIISYKPHTNVVVTVNKSSFRKELDLQGPKSVTLQVPPETEMQGTGKYTKMTIVRSTKLITIVSSNQKKNSVDTSLVYPVTEWGKEYYVFTPSARGYPKEFAVFSGQDATSVTVQLKCAVKFQGKAYKPRDKLTVNLGASEILYLESNEDCTGSRVVSEKPVGVISGHACAWKNSKCQHTFEQLLPVERWGTSFIVPPLEYQVLKDSVYIFASKPTHVTYQFGAKSEVIDLSAGQWKELPMGKSTPLAISSTQPIQVLYYCNGGKFSDGSVFDPFIMNIVPTDKFCQAHSLEGMESFSNYALIIAKTKDIKEVQFDDKHPSFKWEQVHGTEYSWAPYTYEKGRGHHILMHPTAPIGVYSVGTANENGYGAPAACALLTCTHNGQYHPPGKPFWEDSACTELCECNPSTGLVSCKESKCKAGEECTVVEGVSECVAKTIPASVNLPKVDECPVKNCYCDHQGKQMKFGEAWLMGNCSEQCVCLAGGAVQCEKVGGCAPGESCVELDGAQECSTPEATCHLLPSGGFHSFDGLEDRLWMEGTYSLAVPGPDAQFAFRITAHLNLFACEPAVTFTTLFYKDLKVEVKRDLTTEVDGKAVSLPFRTNNGLKIEESQDTVVVRHTSGLTLLYCGSGRVSVTLTAAFRGKMAGLCGNFNGQAKDDLRLRDGSVTEDFDEFYKDLRV
ncbi:IgGFc-binding protein-like [Anguilla rostrata]|uniref:IgGFc-binding protein-like n=1 Tax=Anguilla rostrata TaxID=7938 RepID=UPI0030CC9DB1